MGREHPDWYLRIVGHGDEEAVSYLKSLAAGIPNIEFKPYTPNIREEYQKASVFVLSSRYEGFGLVLTEAMSQGCDCIACDYKGRQSW
ncbi:glycosyltransferase [Segatella sp.]|uniref:glycosyltransferase n=1 Tax=Segatella sp. TaxID=2974253 RepID=UPI00307D1B8D